MAPSAIYLHPRELNSDLVPRHLLANEWRLVEKIWFGGGALYLSKKDAPYRVIGFRSNENTVFENWYVNLQEPLKRTNLGFDYLDMELDVEVSGDLKSYHLKDVNKFEELVQMGVIETEKANFLRKTAFSVAEEIIDGKSIVEKWKNWSPESDLRPAPLPKGWDVI